MQKKNLPKQIIPLRIEKNIGYGNGILKGLEFARGEILSWTHAGGFVQKQTLTNGL